jgi:hypothetical protein
LDVWRKRRVVRVATAVEVELIHAMARVDPVRLRSRIPGELAAAGVQL